MEGNTEVSAMQQTDSVILKRKPRLRTHGVNLIGLINLGKRLKTIKRETFQRRYGNLLSLMEVEVQLPAITALAQYYDSPLRCFTFQDFQLAPIIEEFEYILGLPLEGTTPYQHLEHHASIPTIAAIMKLHPKELEDRIMMRNQVHGLTQGYLEQYLHHLADKEDWETFMDVLALTVCSVVLFPKIEEFVDYTAIDVFVARKGRSENLVTTILADVYGTLSFCHERKGRKILCCLPALYTWMTAHVFKGVVDVKSLSKVLSHQGFKDKGGNEWAQLFSDLSERNVKWRLPWLGIKPSIQHCGSFSNEPLIGARYQLQPFFSPKTIWASHEGAPSPDYLVALFINYEDGHFIEMLRKVKSAWESVVPIEKDQRLGAVDNKVTYQTWILERVKEVKLPFKPINDQPAIGGPFQDEDNEEMKQLRAEMERLREKNVRFEKELQSARNDFVDVKNAKEECARAYEEILKSHKVERDYTFRLKQDLAAANKELAMRVKEKNVALEKGKRWKHLYEEAKRDKRETLKRLREAHVQVEKVGHQMKEMTTSFEAGMNRERWKLAEAEKGHRAMMQQLEGYIEEQEERCRSMEFEERHRALIRRMEDHIAEQEAVKHWKESFPQLATLANAAIEDIPKMVLDAEACTHFFSPP